MNAFTKLVNSVTSANYGAANQMFNQIMQQLVADRMQVEKTHVFKEHTHRITEDESPESPEYQEYFRSMLKKHGYDSPADIPDDKKDDFFNAVDAGYSAKNEGWRK